MDNKLGYEEELYCAEIERSLIALARAWEQEGITASEMVEQLEEIVAICDGKSNYNSLISKYGMMKINDS
jgi:hypothetical protein